ncbi:MAG TPA: ABC transporter permease [Candidatus Babeliales bacterium]|jgi:ABC-type polysaccharide/polyol phosphate export permease|nr:ABC transporter permease [Candidatus Babeliales bacterium]
MNTISYISLVKTLVQIDLLILKQSLFDKLLNITIWAVLSLVVTIYIMPFFGLSADFGIFQLGGILAAVGLFEVYNSTVEMVADLEGDQIINYTLTLPAPSWLILLSRVLYYFILYLTLAILIVPIGMILVWNQIDFSTMHMALLVLTLCIQSIFYAAFALWSSSMVTNMTQMGNIWSRFIFPMWFMGGFQFSWLSLYNALPVVAIINLINPMIYITEAVRTALIGQNGYINSALCLLVILLFSGICFVAGFYNLKKRLDFI